MVRYFYYDVYAIFKSDKINDMDHMRISMYLLDTFFSPVCIKPPDHNAAMLVILTVISWELDITASGISTEAVYDRFLPQTSTNNNYTGEISQSQMR